jgi:hypothetical protein
VKKAARVVAAQFLDSVNKLQKAARIVAAQFLDSVNKLQSNMKTNLDRVYLMEKLQQATQITSVRLKELDLPDSKLQKHFCLENYVYHSQHLCMLCISLEQNFSSFCFCPCVLIFFCTFPLNEYH